MSIQTRFLFALALVLVVFVMVLTLAILTYTAPRLAQWETREAHSQVKRVQRALGREFEHLLIYAREWSVWDDTYRFVQDANPEYIEKNLGIENFAAAKVDLLAYLRDDGQIVWAGFKHRDGVDLETGAKLVEELRPRAQAALRDKPGLAGILATTRGLMAVAVHHVYTSREQGPPQGIMLAGRLLDSGFMHRLRGQTELDVAIAPLKDLAALTGPTDTAIQLAANGDPLVQVISPSQLQLLARFPDLNGQPSLAIRINLSRAVFLQGERIVLYSLLGTAAVFVLTLLVAWLLMRRMVFVPIAALARHTFELRNSGDYTRRFNSPRGDEIGKLARQFDELLIRIEVQAEELKRFSFEDALTGLKNRRYFDEQLRSAWLVLQRSGQPLSLLILDVDDFKLYNDHYGHQQGNLALQAVAQATRQVLRRAVDTVARYGGEEFAAILPGTSLADARVLAERVRRAVFMLAMPHEKSRVAEAVSVTVGVASIETGSGMAAEALIRLADGALYEAKKSGKNTVFIAPEPCQTHPQVTEAERSLGI